MATVFLITQGATNNLVQNNKSSSSRRTLCCTTQLLPWCGVWWPYHILGLLSLYSATAQDRVSRGSQTEKLQKTRVWTFLSPSLLVCKVLSDSSVWKWALETGVMRKAGFCSRSEAAFPKQAAAFLSSLLFFVRQGESEPFLITPKSMRGTATLSLDD